MLFSPKRLNRKGPSLVEQVMSSGLIPIPPAVRDLTWNKGIDTLKQLLTKEQESKNDAQLKISPESRAALVEKLFSTGKNLNRQHVFTTIELIDRYLKEHKLN